MPTRTAAVRAAARWKNARRVRSRRLTLPPTRSISRTPICSANIVTDQGRILPRKYTGMPAHYQRRLTLAIKRARQMLLMK